MRIAVCLGAVLIFACAAVGPAYAQQDAGELARAQRLYEEKDYQRAAVALDAICARQPAFADAHRLLGHVYFAMGRDEEARNALAQAVAYGRLTPDVLARLAQLDQRRGETVALLAGLRLRMLIDPEHLEWNLLYADVLASSGAEGGAKHVYEAILEADPSQPDVFVRLGNLCLRRGEHKEAASAFETAYHLGDPNPDLAETIAELWFNLGDPHQASLWYERAFALRDNPPERSRLRRAQLLFAAEAFEQAEAVARLLADSTDCTLAGKALLLLGQIAVQRGQLEVAVAHWGKAAHIGLDEPQVLAFLGCHYLSSGQYDKAAEYHARRLAGGEHDKALLCNLIVSLIRSGEDERTKSELQTYLEFYGLDDTLDRMVRLLAQVQRETGNE